MAKDKRRFTGSVSIRAGETRFKAELSPAPLYGGPEGCYRIRLARRWLDTEDGAPRFFDRNGLALLATELAVCGLEAPAPAPDIPINSRVSVRRADGLYEGTWTNTAPILDYAGRWMVNVSMEGQRVFVPVKNIIVHKERRRG
mgnify:CR=1 FL=1